MDDYFSNVVGFCPSPNVAMFFHYLCFIDTHFRHKMIDWNSVLHFQYRSHFSPNPKAISPIVMTFSFGKVVQNSAPLFTVATILP